MTTQEAIDRLKAMLTFAQTATARTHRVFAFSSLDAEAIAVVLAELERKDKELATVFQAKEWAESLHKTGRFAESHVALVKALEPFAALWDKSLESRVGGDKAPVWGIHGVGKDKESTITVGDIKRAGEALAKAKEVSS